MSDKENQLVDRFVKGDPLWLLEQALGHSAAAMHELLRNNIKGLQTENLVMVTLLSGIAAGNNSRQDAAKYIKSALQQGEG